MYPFVVVCCVPNGVCDQLRWNGIFPNRLQIDPNNESLKREKQESENKMEEERCQRKKKLEEQEKRVETLYGKQQIISSELEKRGIVMGNPLFDTQRQYEGEVRLDDEGVLHFPVMFLYEEHNQSEFVKDFEERHTFIDHLSYMFPSDISTGNDVTMVPWDLEGKYKLENLEIYFEAHCTKPLKPSSANRIGRRRWIRVLPTSQLIKSLTHPDFVMPGIPVFYIVVSGSKFRDELLRREF